jgi:NDP-mannose synthase
MRAVILAGGEGRRLRPYTTVLPKPLMPVGDKPILEIILHQLASHSFQDITVSVGYLSGLIEAYCADGSRFGTQLTYVRETEPLGTAGPLQLIESDKNPFLVMNGDVLTNLNYRALYEYHLQNGQLLTVATYRKQVQIQLGVLTLDDENIITEYTEKPTLHYPVSMGVYCCSPEVLDYLPRGKRFDLPDLVRTLIENHKPVRAFLHDGFWLDIGNQDDYEKAQDELSHIIYSEPLRSI